MSACTSAPMLFLGHISDQATDALDEYIEGGECDFDCASTCGGVG